MQRCNQPHPNTYKELLSNLLLFRYHLLQYIILIHAGTCLLMGYLKFKMWILDILSSVVTFIITWKRKCTSIWQQLQFWPPLWCMGPHLRHSVQVQCSIRSFYSRFIALLQEELKSKEPHCKRFQCLGHLQRQNLWETPD